MYYTINVYTCTIQSMYNMYYTINLYTCTIQSMYNMYYTINVYTCTIQLMYIHELYNQCIYMYYTYYKQGKFAPISFLLLLPYSHHLASLKLSEFEMENSSMNKSNCRINALLKL